MDNSSLLIEGLARKRQLDQQASLAEEQAEKDANSAEFDKVMMAVVHSTQTLLQFLREYSVQVGNFPKPVTSVATPDVANVVKAIKNLEKTLKPLTPDNSDIVKGFEDLAKKIDGIPATEAVEVTNLNELKTSLSNDLKSLYC